MQHTSKMLNGLLLAGLLAPGNVPSAQKAPAEAGVKQATRAPGDKNQTALQYLQATPEDTEELKERIFTALKDKKVKQASREEFPDLHAQVDKLWDAIPKRVLGLERVPAKPAIYVYEDDSIGLAFVGRANTKGGTAGAITISTGMIKVMHDAPDISEFAFGHEAFHAVLQENRHILASYVPPNETAFKQDGQKISFGEYSASLLEESAADYGSLRLTGNVKGLKEFFTKAIGIENHAILRLVYTEIVKEEKEAGHRLTPEEQNAVEKRVREEIEKDARLGTLIAGNPHSSHEFRLQNGDALMALIAQEDNDHRRGRPWMTEKKLDYMMEHSKLKRVSYSGLTADALERIERLKKERGLKHNPPVYMSKSGYLDKSNVECQTVAGLPYIRLTTASIKWSEKDAAQYDFRYNFNDIVRDNDEGSEIMPNNVRDDYARRLHMSVVPKLFTNTSSPNFPAVSPQKTVEGKYAIVAYNTMLEGMSDDAKRAGIVLAMTQISNGDLSDKAVAEGHNDPRKKAERILKADDRAAKIIGTVALKEYLAKSHAIMGKLYREKVPDSPQKPSFEVALKEAGYPALQERLGALDKKMYLPAKDTHVEALSRAMDVERGR